MTQPGWNFRRTPCEAHAWVSHLYIPFPRILFKVSNATPLALPIEK